MTSLRETTNFVKAHIATIFDTSVCLPGRQACQRPGLRFLIHLQPGFTVLHEPGAFTGGTESSAYSRAPSGTAHTQPTANCSSGAVYKAANNFYRLIVEGEAVLK